MAGRREARGVEWSCLDNLRVRVEGSSSGRHHWVNTKGWCRPSTMTLHQGNLAERIIHYNLHGGVDNGISGIIIPCQPPHGDYNGLSFPLNFPDVGGKEQS